MSPTPAPYSLAIDAGTPPTTDDGALLLLRRYYVAAPLETDGAPWVVALTAHYATVAGATARLPGCLADYPSATISTVLLAFDVNDQTQLDTFVRLAAEADAEAAALQ